MKYIIINERPLSDDNAKINALESFLQHELKWHPNPDTNYQIDLIGIKKDIELSIRTTIHIECNADDITALLLMFSDCSITPVLDFPKLVPYYKRSASSWSSARLTEERYKFSKAEKIKNLLKHIFL